MKNKAKDKITTLLLMVVLIVGVGLLAYPSFSDYWNSFHQSRAISSYAEIVAQVDDEAYQQQMDAAYAYNETLYNTGTHWKLNDEELEEYNSVLNLTGTGVIGYIEIDRIKCTLPIYHGTDERVLQMAVGHVAGSSLPVGGKNTHSVLSGHRGLPSAKLFTDLDKLVVGDVFVIRVLDEMVTYEVDQILIVEPTDVAALGIEKGKDFCTLVTCTPYGVNTHRLLVRGHRIENAADVTEIRITADGLQIEPIIVTPLVAAPILLILLILVLIDSGTSSRRRKKGMKFNEKERKIR